MTFCGKSFTLKNGPEFQFFPLNKIGELEGSVELFFPFSTYHNRSLVLQVERIFRVTFKEIARGLKLHTALAMIAQIHRKIGQLGGSHIENPPQLCFSNFSTHFHRATAGYIKSLGLISKFGN